jgi:hypothetical protein
MASLLTSIVVSAGPSSAIYAELFGRLVHVFSGMKKISLMMQRSLTVKIWHWLEKTISCIFRLDACTQWSAESSRKAFAIVVIYLCIASFSSAMIARSDFAEHVSAIIVRSSLQFAIDLLWICTWDLVIIWRSRDGSVLYRVVTLSCIFTGPRAGIVYEWILSKKNCACSGSIWYFLVQYKTNIMKQL